MTLVANRTSLTRTRVVLEGKTAYVVAPVTLLVTGVLNGSNGPLYYPPEEVEKNPEGWNGIPLVVYHPTDDEGNYVSARDPKILAMSGIGELRNVRAENGRLFGQVWIDRRKARRVDARVLLALKNGTPIEVSTGLGAVVTAAPPGSNHNGRFYYAVARSYEPDHLAVLPDRPGACSLKDGCGILAANGEETMSSDTQLTLWNALGKLFLLGGSSSGTKLLTNVQEDQRVLEEKERAAVLLNTQWDDVLDVDSPPEVITNPFPNQHAARVHNPDQFVDSTFRRKEIAPGVSAIFAKRTADGSMVIQSYRFDASKFTEEEAREWLKKHDVNHVGFEKAAANGSSDNNHNSMGDKVMANMNAEQRTSIVKFLLSNCNCPLQTPWKGMTEEALNKLSDDTLTAYDQIAKTLPVANYEGFVDANGNFQMYDRVKNSWSVIPAVPASAPVQPAPVVNTVPAPQTPAPPATPVVNSKPMVVKPNTLEEWLAIAPPDAQQVWNSLNEEQNRLKAEVVQTLLENSAVETREQLAGIYNGMSLTQLRVIAAAFPAPAPVQPTYNYSGNAGIPVRQQPVTEEPLLPPTFKYSRSA